MFAAISKLLPVRTRPQESRENKSPADHIGLGKRGEEWAVAYLERAGYRIVGANFVLPIGRNARDVLTTAEIDLIAYDGRVLCFVEVKTRASDWFAFPQANVDLRKQRQIARAARAYRRILDLMDAPYRYDVLSVILPTPDEDDTPVPEMSLLKNFWSDSKFRKRRWSDLSANYTDFTDRKTESRRH